MGKKRDSGIELLRIIAILMVIGVHAFLYGNFYDESKSIGGMVYIFATFLRMAFRPAVNIFVMITGYFMVRQKFDLKKAYKRVFNIYISIFFYSVLLSLVTLALGKDFYTINGVTTPVHIIVLKMIFPVLAQNWYFISDYIFLCLFAPFVNIVLQKITKKEYQVLLVISSVVLSLWFMLGNINLMDQVVRNYGYGDMEDGKNVFSFIYVYIIGGYINLHVKKQEHVRYRYLLFFMISLIANCVLATKLEVIEFSDIAIRYTNALVILMAVFLLMFFKDLHFYNKTVNTIASATIGVYAIHEFSYIREFIWSKFNFSRINCANLFLDMVYIVGVILTIFFICTLIEIIRQKLFGLAKQKLKGKSTI